MTIDAMRAILSTSALAALVAAGLPACSASANAGNAAAANATADTAAETAGKGALPPVYPGATPGMRPAGVAEKVPPASVKAYVTSDAFANVKAWYKTRLKGATEIQQPGREKTEDAFLSGRGATAEAVLVQRYKGKTWILIGPPR